MKRLVLVLVVLLAACTATQRQVARTVVDVARTACELFASEQAGKQKADPEKLVRELCATEADLAPWIDSLLSANRLAAAKGGPAPCPAQAPAPPPGPGAVEAPKDAPASPPGAAPASPAPTAAPAPATPAPGG